MTNEGNVQIYRGGHEIFRTLNDIGVDLAELCDCVEGLPGEGTKYVFPVRAQLTYFRLKHPRGEIQTEIIRQDDFQVQVKATVYSEDGKCLATSHGVSTANGDADRGFQMLPTAESRAVGRALSFAGFGCQLRIQTYDGDDFTPNASLIVPEDTTGDSLPGESEVQPVPAAVPDSINTQLKVSANEEKRVLDVHELENSQAEDKPKRRKKNKDESLPSIDPISQRPSEPEGNDLALPKVAANTEDIGSTSLTADEMIEAFLEAARSEPSPAQFNAVYFGENYPGDIDPNAFYVNAKGQPTQVTNGMLQKTINFFISTPGELQKQIKAPVVPTSPNYNKTLGELIEADETGKKVVCLCSEAYRKDNPAVLAGVLVCAKLYCRQT